MTLYYPDVSNNNWGSTQAAIGFLEQLVPQGFSAVCHKVSQGSGYRDPYWPAVRDWCAANDLLCIGYHYVDTSNPASQAQCWNANGGGKFAMLDVEDGSGDINNYWAVVNAFNAAGIQIVLSYLPHWYWQNIGSPDLTGVPGLVSSAYPGGNGYASSLYVNGGGDDGSGWNGYGGATPVAWQFTDRANIAGINVDCNAFKGTAAELAALFTGGTVVAPQPTDPTLAVAQDNQVQLRGPGLAGWPQLGGHTVVDALAAIGQKLGIEGFAPPEGN
ncbi:hypothetical protein C1Y40_04630 [Mycobacterium talmoniae]|uniref:Lysozyme n=1 Tax=Mycobacterium talmoniae TaxID=1858794 RepID=A0A2S8BEW6_9MYCO|nr:hypothetical protein C1Y40_04630 [Mycobacterium talmoniae]